MAETKTYAVLREHDGDKFYRVGDKRVAVPAEVKHLVDLGVLGAGAKSEGDAPKNKAEKTPAPANKAKG